MLLSNATNQRTPYAASDYSLPGYTMLDDSRRGGSNSRYSQITRPNPSHSNNEERSNHTPLSSISMGHESPFADPSNSSSTYRPPYLYDPSKKYLYTYDLYIDSAKVQILIAIDPTGTSPQYRLRAFLKANAVQRPVCESVLLNLTADPGELEFAVFLYPPKASLPIGTLNCLRIWLRLHGIDHRLFADDDLWIGRDPDFNSLTGASFSRLKDATENTQIYGGLVGKVDVKFIVRWNLEPDGSYKLSMEYEAGGCGAELFKDVSLRLAPNCEPYSVKFVIYSVPLQSIPSGASHRLRFWVRSPERLTPASPSSNVSEAPPVDSYIYQRLWYSDTFKVGSQLDFTTLGSKVIMGKRGFNSPQTVVLERSR